MSDLMILGFPDATAARLAYDEVLNLADNNDLTLEALALRTSGPAGRIFIEVPNQLAVGSNASGPQLADFLTTVLEGPDNTSETGCRPSDTCAAPGAAPTVLVLIASQIAWHRFRETMSVFEDITVEMPAGTSDTSSQTRHGQTN
ncbi:MAG: hypothetical protein ACOYD0_09140 [Candidatus Nanopelagicales bacterium]